MNTSAAADMLRLIHDAEYTVYALNSKHMLISYLCTGTMTTDMEDKLQIVRSRKVGSLRIIWGGLRWSSQNGPREVLTSPAHDREKTD